MSHITYRMDISHMYYGSSGLRVLGMVSDVLGMVSDVWNVDIPVWETLAVPVLGRSLNMQN